eukprot:CAMPEP_0113285466 /NCGR_PEP_ID=MMETSP0008_2-20120614/30598_1 /TAXON_ID=97485 /ORGANISM="Prymnesium parvum" /LENGTH=149 /DNA_ID=CAMNT_0000136449 /DNA_START=211 /DNA_END=657 /DNA_ORIENTATION=- /assembly_acc=CAM_ASM_000153
MARRCDSIGVARLRSAESVASRGARRITLARVISVEVPVRLAWAGGRPLERLDHAYEARSPLIKHRWRVMLLCPERQLVTAAQDGEGRDLPRPVRRDPFDRRPFEVDSTFCCARVADSPLCMVLVLEPLNGDLSDDEDLVRDLERSEPR